MIAFALDEALAASDLIADRRAAEAHRPDVAPEDGGLRPDERYAVDEDYAEDLDDAA